MRIAILGLGSSLSEFKAEDFNLSIGVNDIWRAVKSDAVVCINPVRDFKPERYKIIHECKPQAFYSQIVNYDKRPDFVKIDIISGYGADRYVNLDLPGYYKSYCSPFVAAQIGFKVYHAKELHIFGVDLVNHPVLNGALCGKIRIHFINLKAALTAKGCQMIVHGTGILANI
jgi:hypothetical protein